MSAVEKGRFCANCKKTVVDFSKMSPSNSIDYLQSNTEVCGIMTASQLQQLNTRIALNQSSSISLKSILTSLSLTFSSIVWGQTEPKVLLENENLRVIELATGINPDSLIDNKVKAIITDENGEPLAFIKIHIPGMNQYRMTNVDGEFDLHYGDSIQGNLHIKANPYFEEDSSIVAQDLLNKSVQIILKEALKPQEIEMVGLLIIKPVSRIQRFETKVRAYFDYRDKGR